MSLSRILKGTHSRDAGRQLFGSPSDFLAYRDSNYCALLQMFGILSWRMQEVRKSQNQNLRAEPTWSINSGKMESNLGDFPDFRRLRAAGSSSSLKCS